MSDLALVIMCSFFGNVGHMHDIGQQNLKGCACSFFAFAGQRVNMYAMSAMLANILAWLICWPSLYVVYRSTDLCVLTYFTNML